MKRRVAWFMVVFMCVTSVLQEGVMSRAVEEIEISTDTIEIASFDEETEGSAEKDEPVENVEEIVESEITEILVPDTKQQTTETTEAETVITESTEFETSDTEKISEPMEEEVIIPEIITTEVEDTEIEIMGSDDFVNQISDSNTYENYEYSIDNENVTITKYIGNESVVVIPSTIDGQNVTTIGSEAFANCNNITSIELPNKLKKIGENAFYGTQITYIKIPATVTDMSYASPLVEPTSSLNGCRNLETIEFENGITTIPAYAVAGVQSLKRVILPSSVTTISKEAFYKDKKLENIEFPKSLKTIGSSAFYGCVSLKNISFNEELISIESYAFSGCSSITSIRLPSKLKTLGITAFEGTQITYVKIPATITDMRYPASGAGSVGAFSGCKKLETIEFENGITTIPSYGVAGISSLKKVILPSSVINIDSGAFWDDTNLENIEFPESLKKISYKAFYGCSMLSEVILPQNLTTIEEQAFEECRKLKIVQIFKNVTSIAKNSFFDCPVLVIYGYTGSYAETYANNNDIPFVVLDDEDEERGEGFDLRRDGHCVINAALSFSYDSWTNLFGIIGYKIPLERYQEVYGNGYTKHIYNQDIKAWKGNCFGMSTTAALFYKGKLPVINYTHDVGILAAGGYDNMVSLGGRTYLKL